AKIENKAESNPPPATTPQPAAATAAPAPREEPARTAKTEAKEKHEHVAKKAKPKPRKPARGLNNDDDRGYADNDSDDRAARQDDRDRSGSRHVVERWTERDYDVPDDEGDGQRRIIVRRSHDSNPFSTFFGDGDD